MARGETPANPGAPPAANAPGDRPAARHWREAAAADRQTDAGPARWTVVPGLGPSGKAMSLQPATLATAWPEGDADAPTLEYRFESKGNGNDADALIDFLPVFRLVPGMQSRVCVGVDDGPARAFAIPGSDGSEDERGKVRNTAVQDNEVPLRVPLPGLPGGKHVLKISAVNPGVVIDRLSLP